MLRTITEINEKLKAGKAIITTAEEIIDVVKEKGVALAAKEVDIVTTGTFSPMCSSGAYFNIGHTKPRIKLGGGHVCINDVPAYTGFAATDIFIGANALPDNDPRNRLYPGEFNYGGGHVIEEIVAGEDVQLVANSYGTDCYPRKKLATWLNINDINQAVLFNPRNAYQNYNVAVNLSNKTLYTYMGILKPKLGNANFSTAGQLSPLFNDPYYKTIGIGTRVFLGGGIGYIAWWGTQHNPNAPRNNLGIPSRPAATLAFIGDLKQMKQKWLVGTSMIGYGVTLTVGIGIPIPILSDEILKFTSITDADITAPVVDYSKAYPQCNPDILTEVNYAQLRSGNITIKGKKVPTASLSSYAGAVSIATNLKQWLQDGKFLLSEPVAPIPGSGSGYQLKPLVERPIRIQ
ncbi:MAG: homocysteine biosynthesis protein [Dehalococcoidia bacterium]|nr:MAG: homocysteine biosynthesis protein [Dehalococcoidia bacterium]